jgi:hypothetical protein
MKLFLSAIALFLTTIVTAQKIDVTTKGLTVNGKALTANATEKDALTIFGKPEKKATENGDITYNYSSKGCTLYIDPKTKKIKLVMMTFLPESSDTKAFAGKLTIAGVPIDAKTYRDSVYKIPGIRITYKGDEGDDTAIGKMEVTFTYDMNDKSCKRVNIYLQPVEEG